jgi:hypothetical protein
MQILPRLVAFALAPLFAFTALAHGPGMEMADAANNVLAALKPEQKAKAQFEFGSDERENWHFIPKDRVGLPIKEMTGGQRALVNALLVSGFSARGFAKASTIMSLEEILAEMEGPKRTFPRDPELYYLSIFGTPGETNTWSWRVEGHHLSANFTIVNGHEISGTPSFFGTNPAKVKQGQRAGLRVLGVEEDMGRQLVLALTEDQRKTAIYTDKAPGEVLTSNERKAHALDPVGVVYKDLPEDQQLMLLDLIREYASRLRPELANADIGRILRAGVDTIRFGWAGSTEVGKPHYYRVQGPTFLIEYDNTQNNANHVHAVWRDLENDFGGDALARHYEQTKHSESK